MHFAYPLPWWLAALLIAAIGILTFLQYRRPLAPLTSVQRTVLVTCRVIALATLILLLFRPIVLVPPALARQSVVPVLVDTSQSMRLNDADGQTRLARATRLLREQLLPALSRQFAPELFGMGEQLEPVRIDRLRADGRWSDLAGALAAVRERYRGQQIAGIVILTDGGNTAEHPIEAAGAAGPPVFAVGLGSVERIRDREVTGITAGEQRLDQASVDLRVSMVSFGFGREPIQLRLSSNGRELEHRRVVPQADGVPVEEVFTVAPDAANPTVYTAEIVADEAEPVAENNARSVLVNPAGRKRQLLVIEGAPGFEHSFMKRAWASDPSLEVDSVGRKGKNAEGRDTFYVQAGAARTMALTGGFPARREDLYAYDGVALANVEPDSLTQAQLAMTADFVAIRGGGLLVTGGLSFAPRGLAGTPLEDVLPVELNERAGGLGRTMASRSREPQNKVVVTAEGENHPTMRIGETREETERLWSALPPLAAIAPLGGPRPGAAILAVTTGSTGAVYPVVAVQRYGRGRSMIFSGEASWRWKMMLPSTDRSYEYFWRQAARWIAGSAPESITITTPESTIAGNSFPVGIDVRDGSFASVGDAAIDVTLTDAAGETRALKVRHAAASTGSYVVDVPPVSRGLYRISADVRKGATNVGQAVRWVYVGGIAQEFVDPRLNEAWLRRVARASGGRYVRPADVARIGTWLRETVPLQGSPERRDLWHEPWALVFIVALLSAEWILRRRWGLR